MKSAFAIALDTSYEAFERVKPIDAIISALLHRRREIIADICTHIDNVDYLETAATDGFEGFSALLHIQSAIETWRSIHLDELKEQKKLLRRSNSY